MASGVRIREAAAGDASAVERVVRSAFDADDPGSGDRVAAIWRDLEATDLVVRSLVAVDGPEEQVVGHVGLSHAWLDARPALVDVLLLSPLSVLPSYQGREVGTDLVAAALTAGVATGRPAMVLEGSPAFYGERGFGPGAAHGIVAPTDRTPAPAFQVALFATWQHWMTGRVVYPDVWWRHDAAGLRDPVLAEVEERFRNL